MKISLGERVVGSESSVLLGSIVVNTRAFISLWWKSLSNATMNASLVFGNQHRKHCSWSISSFKENLLLLYKIDFVIREGKRFWNSWYSSYFKSAFSAILSLIWSSKCVEK